ncbi:MAG: nitroreductase [Rhodobacterales bacterium CG2_30_65_12]|nr:MAG: nitroreductase [Rhodobacterales bacterium CG2_30_65_12]
MPEKNQAALDFLLTRRSRPAKTLATPVPTHEELRPILTAAARSPDHGKLEPWRFLVLERAALQRLAAEVERRGPARGDAPERIDKVYHQFADAHLVVVVVMSPKVSDKVPEIEQMLSAGAACLAMLNAALASGWGANWLSSWVCHDREFLDVALGLGPSESVAGFIHIGTETVAPPERPRPDIDAITTWVDG